MMLNLFKEAVLTWKLHSQVSAKSLNQTTNNVKSSSLEIWKTWLNVVLDNQL